MMEPQVMSIVTLVLVSSSPPTYEKVICLVLIFAGSLSGIVSTAVATEKILDPASAGLAKPCYL